VGLIADGNGLYLQRPNLSYISRLRFAGRHRTRSWVGAPGQAGGSAGGA
jgi:hypothetical protein